MPEVCSSTSHFSTLFILQALVELHSKGIAYRDLKASNVMLDSLGDVKIIDFGSSKILDSPEGKMSDVASSPHWTAPEVFKCFQHLFGDPRVNGNGKKENRRCSNVSYVEGSYDVRADVWSLGEPLNNTKHSWGF